MMLIVVASNRLLFMVNPYFAVFAVDMLLDEQSIVNRHYQC